MPRRLVQHQVEFILIGGAAATAHGSARLTQDLDIVYRRTPEHIAHLASALASHHSHRGGAPPGPPFRLDVETIEREAISVTSARRASLKEDDP
jgi:hypothetical protein